MPRPVKKSALLGVLLLSSSCVTGKLGPVTVCSPERQDGTEIPVFQCTPPTGEEYTIQFDRAQSSDSALVCQPVSQFADMKRRISRCEE